MGRADKLIQSAQASAQKALDAEVEILSDRPDNIPEDVWELIQDNGRIATERLNEILTSPKFMRLRAGDQAKLIALAQNRAYGLPQTNTKREDKRRGGSRDVTQHELNALVSRATLPEYKLLHKNVEEAEVIQERAKDG